MRTPTRFRAETKYTESTGKKANINVPMMAAVGNGDGATAAVAGRANFFWVRLLDDDNRLTQAYCQLSLSYDDLIYVAKAKDRKLTYYEFVAFIQDVDGEPNPPVCPKWAQVFTVSVNTCQYRLVSEAVTAINALIAAGTTPSAASPWLIQVMAGDFDEGTAAVPGNVTIPQYVHVGGRGEGTILDLDDFELGMAADTSIANIVVTSTGDNGNILMQVSGNNATMRNVRLILTGAGNDGLRLNTYTGIELYHVTLEATEVCGTAIYCDGTTALLWDVKADDTTNWGTAALYLDNGAVVTTKFCEFHAAAAGNDVLTIAGTTWNHFVTNFDPANSTIGGAETALAHGLTNFVDGIEFTGATTLNIITVPDNIAQAMNLVDVGGLEYMRVVSTDANPYLLLFPAGGGKLGLGTLTVPHGGVGSAIFAIDGPDSSAAGPHIQVTTDADDYPLFQLFAYAHDNVQWVFDAYFQGAAWFSSDAGSNFRWIKINDNVYHEYDSGVAQGAAIGWNTGWSMDLTNGAITLGGPSMTVPNGWILGIGPALERIVFDAAGDISVMGAKLGIGTLAPAYLVELEAVNPIVAFDTTGTASYSAFRYLEAGATKGSIQRIGSTFAAAARREFIEIFNNSVVGGISLHVNNVAAPAVVLDVNGHLYPGSNKAQDFGLAGSRWREIFCSLALNTGTSRLVPVQKDCSVCATQLVRSTGGLRVTGEESDFLLAFCPDCGTVAMEELKHRIAPATKDVPKVVLTGVEVLKNSGNTRSVVVNFRYGDDVESEEGTVELAPHNSTVLSDDELVAFLKMTDEQRRSFLLGLGRIEWDALEKMEVIGPELDDEQAQIDSLIRGLVGKDLLRETPN